jgi:hypothetical protein
VAISRGEFCLDAIGPILATGTSVTRSGGSSVKSSTSIFVASRLGVRVYNFLMDLDAYSHM